MRSIIKKVAKTVIVPKNNLPYQLITFTCSNCQSQIRVGSTLSQDTKIEICARCHPFFTGKQTYVSAAGRVERFRRRASNLKKK